MFTHPVFLSEAQVRGVRDEQIAQSNLAKTDGLHPAME